MITINIDKAKLIAHDIRRASRAEEFKPFDELIAKQIPGVDAQAAEVARQVIREKYNTMQASIDSASTVDEIKAVLPTQGGN
jgi:hypothetical protein